MLALLAIAIFARNRISAGLALGGGILIKVYPVVLLVGLLAQRRWKQTALALAGTVVVSLLFYTLTSTYLTTVAGRAGYMTFRENIAPHVENFVDSIDVETVRTLKSSHFEAGRYLRQVASSSDIVATNITFSPMMPALTGLQALVSGLAYQAPYGFESALPLYLDRERASWSFIENPSPTSLQAICNGDVSWVWVGPNKTEMTSWEPYAEMVFNNDDVSISRLDTKACAT